MPKLKYPKQTNLSLGLQKKNESERFSRAQTHLGTKCSVLPNCLRVYQVFIQGQRLFNFVQSNPFVNKVTRKVQTFDRVECSKSTDGKGNTIANVSLNVKASGDHCITST